MFSYQARDTIVSQVHRVDGDQETNRDEIHHDHLLYLTVGLLGSALFLLEGGELSHHELGERGHDSNEKW